MKADAASDMSRIRSESCSSLTFRCVIDANATQRGADAAPWTHGSSAGRRSYGLDMSETTSSSSKTAATGTAKQTRPQAKAKAKTAPAKRSRKPVALLDNPPR
jgi:hypothetical protein